MLSKSLLLKQMWCSGSHTLSQTYPTEWKYGLEGYVSFRFLKDREFVVNLYASQTVKCKVMLLNSLILH